jgi:hypothetical protein
MADFPIYRLVKGTTLTFTEMDNNLRWLSQNMSGSKLTLTGSSINMTGSVVVEGDLQVYGTASIGFIKSQGYSTGSNQLGDDTLDRQTLIGIVSISGSMNVSGSTVINNLTGSLFGTSSQAVSASYAFTASSAISSYTASSAVSASLSISASYAYTASSAVSAYTASSAVNSTSALTASSADNFVVRQSITASNALFTGTITAQTLVVQTVTSSIVYSSGSNIFGNDISNTQTLTGSVGITGSLTIDGPLYATASQAISASHAQFAISSSYPISVTGSNLYSTSPIAGIPNASPGGNEDSIFLGSNSGYQATDVKWGNFLGYESGYQATYAESTNFLGFRAGYQAVNAVASNFIGDWAGYGAVDSTYSNFIGANAGRSASYAYQSNFIGNDAGSSANNAIYSNFIGYRAGILAGQASYSTFIGDAAGSYAYSASVSVFIGSSAGASSTNAVSSVFIGQIAGNDAPRASYSNFIGEAAGQLALSASYSNFIGYNAGYRAKFASQSILIGKWAGAGYSGTNGIGSNNIIIGNNISFVDDRKDSINIGAIIFATGSYSGNLVAGLPFKGTSNGRVGINQTNPTASLDVSGSGRFTNGLTVTQSVQISQDVTSSAQLIARNFGGDTYSWIRNNTTTGQAILRTEARAGTAFDFGRRGESLSPYKIIAADDGFIMNSGINSQHIAILNDNAVGIIKIAAGGASSPHITIHQTGLVAISSSLEVSSSLNVSRNITGSNALFSGIVIAQGFSGSLFGTSSWAQNSITASNFNGTGSNGFVSNMSDTYTGTAKITDIVTLSAAEYAAIGAPLTSTLYVVI